jgi:hypothetical protein
VEEASADALLLSADEASVKQRTKACCTDQPMEPRMGQSDASSLRIAEGDVDMLEESDAESLYRNANQGRFHQHVGGWVDVELQVSLEHANSYQTDELLFQSVERNVNFSQETNSGFPIRKIDYEGCGDQVEPSIVIASKVRNTHITKDISMLTLLMHYSFTVSKAFHHLWFSAVDKSMTHLKLGTL